MGCFVGDIVVGVYVGGTVDGAVVGSCVAKQKLSVELQSQNVAPATYKLSEQPQE